MESKKHFKMYKSGKQWVVAGITTAVATLGTVTTGNHHVKADTLATATTQSTPTQAAQSSRTVALRSTSTTTTGSSSSQTTVNQRKNVQSSEISSQVSKNTGVQNQAKNTTSQTNITAAQEAANQQILDNGKNTFRENQTANIYNMTGFSAGAVPNRSLGVDVSSYQGTNMAPYAQAGATFSIVKVSQGTGYVNPNAAGQISSSEANGMMTQGYHYATFGGNSGAADAEAAHAIAAAQQVGLPKGTYLACDYEQYASGDVNANTNAVIEFMQRIKNAGYIPLLYSGAYYMKTNLNLSAIVSRFGNCLWIASYPTMSAVDGPNFNYFPSTDGVIMWQYTDNWKGMNVDSSVNVVPMQTANHHAPGFYSPDGGKTTYYYDENGNQAFGSQFVWGHWRYFNPHTGAQVKDGYATFDGHTYYYGADGGQVYGSQLINGHWQYFDPHTGAQTINGFATFNGHTYYYDGNGNQVYGSRFVWGHWRYFNPHTGAQLKNGYATFGGHTYYYGADGSQVYGSQLINGHWQYFDPHTGAQVKSGYATFGGRTYYYDGNGNQVYGSQLINGHWQYFDPHTGVQTISSFASFNGHTYYYDENGNQVYGSQFVWGHWRYFNPHTGAQLKNGYATFGGHTYYYGADGSQIYGSQLVNNHWQYFDPHTGAQLKNGYATFGGRTYYYDGNGNQVYGSRLVNGHWQYFDPHTGAQFRNCTAVINGKKYTFDLNGDIVG